MKTKLLGFLFLLLCPSYIQAQNKEEITRTMSNFYCSGWLFDFPDTIRLAAKEDSVHNQPKYSEAWDNGRGYYNLLCWSAGFMNPGVPVDRLYVKIGEHEVTFKIGGVKCTYIFQKTGNRVMLIKKDRNPHKKYTPGKYGMQIQI